MKPSEMKKLGEDLVLISAVLPEELDWYHADYPHYVYTIALDMEEATKIRRIFGYPHWSKEFQGEYLEFVAPIKLGTHDPWDVHICIPRDAVCKQVPTGRKITKPVLTYTGEVEEDEYVWECPRWVVRSR
jgi:hypothetical protein